MRLMRIWHCIRSKTFNSWKIAKTPKTTNNSRNIVFSTHLNLEHEYIKQKSRDGQKGVAKFVVDNILTDDCETLYKCKDVSRKTCEYLSIDDCIEKDVNTTKLRKAVGPSIKDKSLNITRDNYVDDVDQQKDLYNKYIEIVSIDKAPEVFSKTIAELTS